MRIFISIILLALLSGCDDAQESVEQSVLHRTTIRDYGDLETYQNCRAKPRRELTKLEKCEIEVLAEHCTPAADCLITCISSPDGYKRGGGCVHVCLSPPVSHPWESLPKVGFEKCRQFEPEAAR